jgi:predicted Holliday junction resolvase-like endonuclease
MLNKNDMAAIRALMTEVVKEVVKTEVKEVVQDLLDQNLHILEVNLRDEMHAMNKALENRLNKKIEDTRAETVSDIAEILEGSVLPQIHELQCEMIVVKQEIVELKQQVVAH